MKAVAREKPRGYTLFEMVLVVAGATMILASCGVLLHSLLRLDRVGRNHMNDTLTVTHLAEQFRQDVRTASKAERSPSEKPGPSRLILTSLGAPIITYEVDANRLLRTETLGEKVVRREVYGIERLGPVAFEQEGGFVGLILERRPEEPGSKLRPRTQINARLGKHAPLASKSETKP